MLVTLKNLQQQTFKIEIDDKRTVLELKSEIFRKLGENYPVERQKLIYTGVVLLNDRSLASYNVDERKFIVVMVSHIGTQTDSNEPNNAEVNGGRVAENTQTIANEPSNEASSNVESTFVTGEEYNRSVAVLMEMGFSRELVEGAMAASFNNPERAFEYLVNGVPEHLGTESASEVDNDVGMNVVRGVLDTLRQNPALLRGLLQNIGITDPNVIQQITNNPDAFLETLNRIADNQSNNAPAFEGIPQERLAQLTSGMAPYSGAAETNRPHAAPATAVENVGPQERVTNNYVPDFSNGPVIVLSQAEEEAVERIKDMGFSAERVIQAYIACEKNEEMTVNYLLSNSEE